MKPPALAEWFATDYIHGDRFAALADIRFEPGSTVALDAGQILYCATDHTRELFTAIGSRKRPCILITHNSDRIVDASLLASKPACVRHWFAQNAMVDRPDVTAIPIGLERPQVRGGRTRAESFQAAARQTAPVRNLTYLNHSDWTNRRERIPIRWSLAWRDWVTARRYSVPFDQYLAEMALHKSVISPVGNGPDCHRTWEALYLGGIPLVRESPPMTGFGRLFPIALFVRLTTLTRQSVLQEIAKVSSNASDDWQEHLRFSWWAQRIFRMRDQSCAGWSGDFVTLV
jgi:hypothetical protein